MRGPADRREDDSSDSSPVLSRQQGLGCLVLAAFALGIALLCVVLGIRCVAREETFNCIGLLTVFPLAFAAIAITSAAVGLQRFTSQGREGGAAARRASLAGAWQPLRTAAPLRERRSVRPPDVIELPGRSDQPSTTANRGEATTADGSDVNERTNGESEGT